MWTCTPPLGWVGHGLSGAGGQANKEEITAWLPEAGLEIECKVDAHSAFQIRSFKTGGDSSTEATMHCTGRLAPPKEAPPADVSAAPLSVSFERDRDAAPGEVGQTYSDAGFRWDYDAMENVPWDKLRVLQ